MRSILFQYQSKVEPLEPIAAIVIPSMSSWYQQTNESLIVKEKFTLENYTTEILEPTLFVVPDFSWFIPVSEQTFIQKQTPIFEFNFPFEEILAAEVIFDWFSQVSEPLFLTKALIIDTSVEPLVHELVVDSKFSDWFTLTQIPIQPDKSYPGYSVEPLEPTLYIEPDFNSWFRQASEPVLPLKPLVNIGLSVTVLDSTLFTAVIIISAPFCVVAQQTYLAGAVLSEGYTAGAVIAENYTAGSKVSQQVC